MIDLRDSFRYHKFLLFRIFVNHFHSFIESIHTYQARHKQMKSKRMQIIFYRDKFGRRSYNKFCLQQPKALRIMNSKITFNSKMQLIFKAYCPHTCWLCTILCQSPTIAWSAHKIRHFCLLLLFLIAFWFKNSFGFVDFLFTLRAKLRLSLIYDFISTFLSLEKFLQSLKFRL